MLLLRAKIGEVIHIGDDTVKIHLTSVDTLTGEVELGFEADPSIIIDNQNTRKKRDLRIARALNFSEHA